MLLMFVFNFPLYAQEQSDPWEPLKMFEGQWVGHETGAAGIGQGERSYEFIMNGKYLYFKNKSTFEPQEKNPEGEVHEDWGFFSYDNFRKTIVLRQFHSEGYVNQYTIIADTSDLKSLILVTESIENVPDGFRARYIYKFKNENEFTEIFELASPGKDFNPLLENHWTRVKK